MAFKDLIGKVFPNEKQRAAREEQEKMEKKRLEDERQKELAQSVRNGAEGILFQLGTIHFAKARNLVPDDKVNAWQLNAEAFKTALKNAPTMVEDLSEVDGYLENMAVLLKEAVEKGNVETADRLFKAIAWGIGEARKETIGLSENQVDQMWNQKVERLQRLQLQSQMSMQVEDLHRQVLRMEKEQEQKKQQYKNAYDSFQEELKQHPELKEELDEAIVSHKPLSGAAAVMDVQKRNLVNLYNEVSNIARVRATLLSRQEEYRSNMEMMDLQMKDSSDLQIGMIRDQMAEMQKSFQESMFQQQKEIDALAGMTDRFNALMEGLFSSQSMLDRILKNEMKYQEIEKEMQEIEAAKARAIKLEQEQKQQMQDLQQVEPTLLVN